jgi:hypothetical protein
MLRKELRQMAKAQRMMTYTGSGRPYLDPRRRWPRPDPHTVIERLLGTELPDREGEAVGLLLFGKNVQQLREWWDTAVRAERMERFLEASQQYNLIAARVLAEDYLTPQKRIAVWLPRTKAGALQTQGAVWSLLDRARRRVGAKSNRELRGMVLEALHRRAQQCLQRSLGDGFGRLRADAAT